MGEAILKMKKKKKKKKEKKKKKNGVDNEPDNEPFMKEIDPSDIKEDDGKGNEVQNSEEGEETDDEGGDSTEPLTLKKQPLEGKSKKDVVKSKEVDEEEKDKIREKKLEEAKALRKQ